jgi:hypothetical protein
MYRVYDTQDVELYDQSKAKDKLSLFTAIFGERPTATQKRRMQSSAPHRNRAAPL